MSLRATSILLVYYDENYSANLVSLLNKNETKGLPITISNKQSISLNIFFITIFII